MTEAEQAPKRRKLDLSVKILIALVGGVLVGLFFGEGCGWLKPIGDVYVGLLQMTVLPYIMISLVAGIGRLSLGDSRRLLLTGLKVLLLLWVVGGIMIVASSLCLPTFKAGSFFSASTFEPPVKKDLIQLFVPYNVFESLASSLVPAVVLFCLFVGLALIAIPRKQKLIEVLDVMAEALQRVNKSMVGWAPYGTFAIAAAAAGTMQMGELARLQAYVLVYTGGVLFLAFLVLPLLITSLTPFTYREIFRASKTALITAFATGKVIVVLPLLVAETQALFQKHMEDAKDAADTDAVIDTIYPVSYPFPQLGKILALIFIPFTAWFVGRPLALGQYPSFLAAGYLAYFGGPVVATPFLLDMYQLPADMFKLFLAAGVYTSRIGDLLGTMHLVAVAVLTTAALNGLMRPRWGALLKGLGLSVGLGVLIALAIHARLEAKFKDSFAREKVLEGMALSLPGNFQVEFEIIDAGPNPDVRREGETTLQRIKRRGMLRVGYLPGKRPFSYENAHGELVGLDVELAHLLAMDLDVQLEFVPTSLATLAADLEADHFDLAMSGIAATPERSARMVLSVSYLDLTVGLVLPDHRARDFDTMDDLREAEDLHLGVGDESVAHRARRALPNATIVPVPKVEAYFSGAHPELDALLLSAEIAAAWTLRYPEFAIVNPFPQRMSLAAAYALAPGDPSFVDYVNTWVEFNRRLGWIDKLYAHWVLGLSDEKKPPRWSILRDVLGWRK